MKNPKKAAGYSCRGAARQDLKWLRVGQFFNLSGIIVVGYIEGFYILGES